MRDKKKAGHDAAAGRGRRRRSRQLPPPDPATRVELDGPSRRRQYAKAGELTVMAGLIGVLAATGSKFLEVVNLPSSSEVSVAAFGLGLVVLGLLQRRRLVAIAPVAVEQDITAEVPVTPPDLPSLTGEIAELLAQLRHDYGLAYRTSTWLDEVLPAVGFTTTQPELTRDVLAVSALDAGGIRADVSALARTHSADVLVRAGSALLVALRHVRDACDQRDLGIGQLPASDASSWSAALVG